MTREQKGMDVEVRREDNIRPSLESLRYRWATTSQLDQR